MYSKYESQTIQPKNKIKKSVSQTPKAIVQLL